VSNPIHFLVLLGVLAVYVGQTYLAGRIASAKGRSFGLYLAAALVIGPLMLLATALLPRSRRLG